MKSETRALVEALEQAIHQGPSPDTNGYLIEKSDAIKAIRAALNSPSVQSSATSECPACAGTGWGASRGDPCHRCGGSGRIPSSGGVEARECPKYARADAYGLVRTMHDAGGSWTLNHDHLTIILHHLPPPAAGPAAATDSVSPAADGALFERVAKMLEGREFIACWNGLAGYDLAGSQGFQNASDFIAWIIRQAYRAGWSDREDDLILGIDRIVPLAAGQALNGLAQEDSPTLSQEEKPC